MKASYYQTKMVITQEEAKKLERCTQKQAGSVQWICERRKRLTASRVGGVAKMRKTTKGVKRCRICYILRFEATRPHIMAWKWKTQQFRSILLTNPWLAASPDGTVYDSNDASQPLGLVDIKKPQSTRHMALSESCTNSALCLDKRERWTSNVQTETAT